jgi:hypothetical protein
MKKKYSSAPIQKRCSLLLEVLIALFLVALCLTPLLSPLFHLKKTEIAQQRTHQKRKEMLLKKAAIKEALFERQISWENLHGFNGEGYRIEIIEEFEKKLTSETYRLLRISLDNEDSFTLLIKRTKGGA